METFLMNGERLDELGDGYSIIQHPEKYCFTSDAVALANSVTVSNGDCVIDLCTGSGIIGLLLAIKNPSITVTGIDLQADMVDMASRSAAMNSVDNIDFKNIRVQDAVAQLGHECADVVTVNPPYRKVGAGQTSENPAIMLSRSEAGVTLDEVLVAAGKLLKTGGHFFMIHQAERLAEIFCKMRACKIEPKVLRFINPQTIIVEGKKGGREGLKCFI